MKSRIIDDDYNEVYDPDCEEQDSAEEMFPDALFDKTICNRRLK